MKYFTNIKTAEELKKAYKKLAVMLHPDNGGDEEKFKEMQNEFSKLFEQLKNIHVNKEGKTWEATGEWATKETAADFMNIIEKLMFMQDLTVELCGSWIWVGGNTKEHKDLLKELNFKFSANKQMWYYNQDGFRKHSKKVLTIDEIRAMYGSKTFKDERMAVEG